MYDRPQDVYEWDCTAFSGRARWQIGWYYWHYSTTQPEIWRQLNFSCICISVSFFSTYLFHNIHELLVIWLYTRVVHSSHFCFIFASFLFSFSISFSKNEHLNEIKINWKMTIFQKWKHTKASTKNDHFSPNFTSHFLDPFSSSATQRWVSFSQSPRNISTSSLWHQTQRERPPPTSQPQAPNEPENLRQR